MSAAVQYDAFAPDAPKEIVALAQELAMKAGPSGITADDIRIVATQRGLLDNVGYGREYSFLGSLGRMAGLVAKKGEFRRSILPHAHGNLRRVWVLPQWA